MFTKKGLVIEYVRKYPETPSLTLAKLIYRENSKMFNSVESVRLIVREIRGQKGNRDRKKAVIELKTAPGSVDPFDALPEGIKSFGEWDSYPIPDKRTLCLFDLHAPYHDKPAITAALKYAKAEGVDSILIQEGFDFYQLSTFEKDPRRRHTGEEVQILNDILHFIKDYIKPTNFYYQRGNHCDRWDRYLKVKAPELLGVRDYGFANLFDASLGIKLTPDRKIVKFGKLNCVHGHEFGGSMIEPVSPARGLFMRGGECSIAGHWHRTSNHSARTMTDNIVSCWTLGCLCELHPEYRPINNWNHGFAIVEQFDEDQFIVHNKRIINGKVYS